MRRYHFQTIKGNIQKAKGRDNKNGNILIVFVVYYII